MNVNRGVCPPEKRLRERCAIVKPDLKFKIGFARVQADAMHALQTVHWVMIGTPNGAGAVSVFLKQELDRHECGRAVVLWPVEFDTARNPRARQTDQRGLDHVLPIKEVIPVGLVHSDMNTATDFWQHHHDQEYILNMRGLP